MALAQNLQIYVAFRRIMIVVSSMDGFARTSFTLSLSLIGRVADAKRRPFIAWLSHGDRRSSLGH